ncbi:MAG: hypothetical protein AAFZ15_33800 [Bacteroidota bacterium]
MGRSIPIFVAAGILSLGTFYFKSEHSYDMHLVIPVGIYFITAYLLAFKPAVALKNKLIFSAISLLVWLVLFGASYNLFFFVAAPLSGGIGAWLIILLSKKYLNIDIQKKWPVIIIGLAAAVLGLAFMVLVKKGASIGIKAGIMVALWQIGVGIFTFKEHDKLAASE